MISSSQSALTLLCGKNNEDNCENVCCECLDSESWTASFEDESRVSFAEADYAEEEPRKKLSLWEQILEEFREETRDLDEWRREQEKLEPGETHCGAVEYLNNEIFPVLLPGMVEMLREAEKADAIQVQKCWFSGLDYLAEYLWNKNPRYPERQFNWQAAFNIPPFRLWLKANPRPIYPKSWLWTREEAAVVVQKYVRGWMTRKRDDVQELRQFWKAFAEEKKYRGSSTSSINLEKFELLSEKNQEKFDPCKIFK